MAEAITRKYAGTDVEVHSTGTAPKGSVNQLSIVAVAEIGASMDDAVSSEIDTNLLRRADRVIVLGAEAVLDPVSGMVVTPEIWITDEPSLRGIDGIERMRLIRDDIERRVRSLLTELGVSRKS